MQYFAYSQKAFVYKYVVMLSDIDQFKHMSFANYLKLMFLASDALFVSCFDEQFLTTYRARLLQARMQFKRQTVAGDHILIKVNATEIDKNRFSLLHTFVIEGSGDLVGLGRQAYELFSFSQNSSVPMVGQIKNLLIPISVDEKHLLYKY